MELLESKYVDTPTVRVLRRALVQPYQQEDQPTDTHHTSTKLIT